MKLGRYVNLNVLWPGVPGKWIGKMRTDWSTKQRNANSKDEKRKQNYFLGKPG